MNEKPENIQEKVELNEEELTAVSGGSHNYEGNEYRSVYSFTDCWYQEYRNGNSVDAFEFADKPGFSHPIYRAWWDCSTQGQCGCCKFLYIDGASSGICWKEHHSSTSYPPR